MTDPEAVGDDRAAADDRLEHGQAGARVHERVGGAEHVAHPIGEAHQPQTGVLSQPLGHPGPQLVVAPAQTEDDRIGDLERRPGGAEQVTHAPATA